MGRLWEYCQNLRRNLDSKADCTTASKFLIFFKINYIFMWKNNKYCIIIIVL